MIIKNIQKSLSVAVLATFLTLYSAPVGMCIAKIPQIDAGIQKPVLRENIQPSSLKLVGDVSLSKANPKITLSLRDSDVKQVLRMLADKAGLNIIFHSSVDTGSSGGSSSGGSVSSGPKVTMDLVNVPLNDAFKMIMQVSGLTYYMDNNTLVIASAAAASTLNISKQELMSIPVKYIDAGAMATFLNKNIFSINTPGLSNAEIAVTNPEANEILIFGTKNDFLMAKKVIAQFDKKPLQETFTVNHTTPAEMANLLCNVLLKSTTGTSSTSSSSSSSGTDLVLGAGTVACQYNNPVTAGSLSSLGTNNLSVTYFTKRGTIAVVGGSAQQLELIRDFIAKNDKKQPQAYLEISIIELSESGIKQFDNVWNVYSGFFNGSFNGGKFASNPQYPNFVKGDNFDVYKLLDDGYTRKYGIGQYSGPLTLTYTMNYILQNGKGRVLANPRILITNGDTSTIDLSSDYVKTVTSQVLTNSGSLTPTVQRTYSIGSDEGIKVEIVPFISPEGYVTLNIKPEYSTEKEKVYTPSATDSNTQDLAATLLQRRNLDLKGIRIKDGETLVIGGMIREDEHKTTAKIPVLGDLPGVGMFFRNTDTTKEKQELVIMITPKIIKDSEDVISTPNMTL